MRFSIVCATNNIAVLEQNLLASPGIRDHDIHLQVNQTNVCQAYNTAAAQALENIILFVHQDVFLPEGFFPQLEHSLQLLSTVQWGVLGVAGRKGIEYRGNVLDRGAFWGSTDNLPIEVDTLDELILIMRKGQFLFDVNIPSYHLFGSDVCLQAKRKGLLNFAIPAFCHHNSQQDWQVPKSMDESAAYIRQKWKTELPIYSTCMDIA